MQSIRANNLSKTYPQRNSKEEFFAVRDLNFEINEGEVVAFLGPNGAGKSTTIKMLCGILTPTLGEGSYYGFACGKSRSQ